jgi:hypothetical protein
MINYCDRIRFVSIDTISDVWFNLGQIIRLPTNLILQLVDRSPEVRRFFEIDCTTGTSGVWIFISLVLCFLILILVALIFDL